MKLSIASLFPKSQPLTTIEFDELISELGNANQSELNTLFGALTDMPTTEFTTLQNQELTEEDYELLGINL